MQIRPLLLQLNKSLWDTTRKDYKVDDQEPSSPM